MKKIIAIAAVATLCATSLSFASQPSTTHKQPTGKYMMTASGGKYKNTTYYRKAHHKHSCGCNHKG